MPGNSKSLEIVHHHLQLNEDLSQHRRGWVVQKIGWAVLFSGLMLALMGVFGTGPVSRMTKSENGVQVQYERFLRYESETEMTFTIRNARNSITLEIPQPYLEYIDVISITPMPLGNKTVNGITTYYFNAQGTASIHCNLMARKTGNIQAAIVVNNTTFIVNHLIYP